MSRCRQGNPKQQSRFICCKCLDDNPVGGGIQRGGKQREKGHVKNLYCIQCRTITKNVEVRYCDNYFEAMERALELHKEYYEEAVS